MTTTGEPKDEYLDASNNMRQFGNIRFAQLTLFFGLTAGIMAILFQNTSVLPFARTALKVGGLAITLLFWVMDQRAMDYWNHFRKRAIELEDVLGFKQYRASPAIKRLNTTNAVRARFLLLAAFWIIALIRYQEF